MKEWDSTANYSVYTFPLHMTTIKWVHDENCKSHCNVPHMYINMVFHTCNYAGCESGD